MSVIGDLLGKIRAKRQQKFASVAEQYDAAVLAIASGEQVDADNMASMLDSLDLSDSDLEGHIKAKQRRIEIVAQLATIGATEKQLEKNEADMAKLNAEVEAFLRDKRPKIAALDISIREMRTLVSARSSLTHDLQFGQGIPLHLATRRDELATRRKAWGARERSYLDSIQQPRELIRQHNNLLEVIDEKLRRAAAADRPQLQEERAKAEAECQRFQSAIDSLAADKASLDSEIREIEKLEAELNRQLMQP